MATRYIAAVSNAIDQAIQARQLPMAAGLVYRTDLKAFVVVDPLTGVATPVPAAAGAVLTVRQRFTIAEVNAGATVVAAIEGLAPRMVDMTMIAIGGNAGGATGVLVRGTAAAAGVSLISAAVAALTRSTVVKPNTANVAVLADGASFTAMDENTAITIIKDGADVTTATHIDLIFNYVLEG